MRRLVTHGRLLLALGVVCLGLARLVPNGTAVRLLDVAGTVLGGLAFVALVLPIHS